MDNKDAKIEEKSATIRGLMETMRKNVKTRVHMENKVKMCDKVKKRMNEKQKEIANLRAQLQTKDALTVVKKCKKCQFTAPNMQVLGLHMENDHQYEFECTECQKKFPFKNQLKLHRR